jgi:putative transcriptional regulator
MRTLTALQTTLATALCLSSTLAVLMVLRAEERALPDSSAVEVQSSLAGRLLVASPDLNDPYFAGTVIYMLAHDDNGALGVVLNRRRDHEEPQGVTLWDGGPVGRNRVFVLHDDVTARGSVQIDDVAVATDPAILDELFAGRGPAHARVFVGYAGWGPGQLEGEIADGAWHTETVDARDRAHLLLSDR